MIKWIYYMKLHFYTQLDNLRRCSDLNNNKLNLFFGFVNGGVKENTLRLPQYLHRYST